MVDRLTKTIEFVLAQITSNTSADEALKFATASLELVRAREIATFEAAR